MNCHFFTPCTTVRGVNVGIGHGSSIGSAKREASMQALEYLRSHGNDPTTTAIRIRLTRESSTSLNATVMECFWVSSLIVIDRPRTLDSEPPIRRLIMDLNVRSSKSEIRIDHLRGSSYEDTSQSCSLPVAGPCCDRTKAVKTNLVMLVFSRRLEFLYCRLVLLPLSFELQQSCHHRLARDNVAKKRGYTEK